MPAVLPIVSGLALYLALGLAFALVFVTAGVQRLDGAARSAGAGFRLLILAGSALCWPALAWRWWSLRDAEPGTPPPERAPRLPWGRKHRRAHLALWLLLGPAALLLLVLALDRRAPAITPNWDEAGDAPHAPAAPDGDASTPGSAHRDPLDHGRPPGDGR